MSTKLHKIHIKPSHKGKFTSWAKSHGMTVAEAASTITNHANEYSKHVRKMAVFAKNFGKKKHAYGGEVMAFGGEATIIPKSIIKRPHVFAMGGQVPVEVEGDEVAQAPNGNMMQFNGPSHEEGGIDTQLPQGTDIYSDRLSIDGKTLAERKLSRERAIGKLKKQIEKRPTDALIKNSIKRTEQTNAQEEQQDMFLQKAAQHILPQPVQSGKQKAAYGVDGLIGPPNQDEDNYDLSKGVFNGQSGNTPANPYTVGNIPISKGFTNSDSQPLPSYVPDVTPINSFTPSFKQLPNLPDFSDRDNQDTLPTVTGSPNTIGNVAGMVGSAINAVGPLLNTKKYWKNRVPNTNSFVGFNHDALKSNDLATDQLRGQEQNLVNTNTEFRNNAINRNNQARSINTRNALNAATDQGFNDSNLKVHDMIANQTMQLLNERSKLLSAKDSAEMSGKQYVQQQDKADVENYFSQKGKDLANLGTSVQTFGKNLNQQKQQDDFLTLLPSLSKYGLGIKYVNGKPTLVNSTE